MLSAPALQVRDVNALQLVRSFHCLTQDGLRRRKFTGQDGRSAHNVEAEAYVRRVSEGKWQTALVATTLTNATSVLPDMVSVEVRSAFDIQAKS